jgi:hypothetical protein
LAEVKEALGYTNWVPWLEREFRWSETQAERFIALHSLRRLVPNVGDWEVPISALYLLAEKSTPPEVIEAIAAKAKAGERVTVTEVKEAKAKRKPRLPSYIPTQEAAITPASPSGNARLGRAATARAVAESTALATFKAAAGKWLPLLSDTELKVAREYVASNDWRRGAVS